MADPVFPSRRHLLACARLSERGSKLHAVTDTDVRPIRFFMTTGQVSAYTGAGALLSGLPSADWLLEDRGYDADWCRDTLKDKGTGSQLLPVNLPPSLA